jgi:hypothetical protein
VWNYYLKRSNEDPDNEMKIKEVSLLPFALGVETQIGSV